MPDRVRVPVPTFVRPPPPLIMPLNVVFEASPTVRTDTPSNDSVVPATPANELNVTAPATSTPVIFNVFVPDKLTASGYEPLLTMMVPLAVTAESAVNTVEKALTPKI